MRVLVLMITKMFEYWFIDLLEVIKMFYPPLIDDTTILFYVVSFFMTTLMLIGMVFEIIRELLKEERRFDFIYGTMGVTAIFYILGAIIPYALEYFPPFG